ncbi:MAG: hypothetical protein LC662_06480 [Rhodothermaceae bacterium]|nr:hypothetical protein [Rhodothermaceae bacterium]
MAPAALNNKFVLFLSVIIILLAEMSACVKSGNDPEWTSYLYAGDVSFTLDYPATWNVEQERETVRFQPPGNDDVRIDLVIIDPELSPPLPVHITYDTLRVVEHPDGPIPVLKRDSAAITERYFALMGINNHIVEMRLYSWSNYDLVFDHMLVTMIPVNSN